MEFEVPTNESGFRNHIFNGLRKSKRLGIGAVLGVLLIGALVIVGTASMVLYVLPGNSGPGTHDSPSFTTITGTITTHVTLYSTSTVLSTSVHTKIAQFNSTSTLTSTQLTTSTQHITISSTVVSTTITTQTYVVVTTVTVP